MKTKKASWGRVFGKYDLGLFLRLKRKRGHACDSFFVLIEQIEKETIMWSQNNLYSLPSVSRLVASHFVPTASWINHVLP